MLTHTSQIIQNQRLNCENYPRNFQIEFKNVPSLKRYIHSFIHSHVPIYTKSELYSKMEEEKKHRKKPTKAQLPE